MEYEIIKQAFKLGNSAGVLLPIEWKGKKVSIRLIEKSLVREILEILEERGMLENTIGVFLAGSYARGEETEKSDVDVLVITNDVDKQIKVGKYEIICISKDKFEKALVKNLYLASLVNEAKAILNSEFLQECKKKVSIFPIKKYLNEILSMTKINEMAVKIDEELGENVSDETIYSVILRLRELYLIECLTASKNSSNREFVSLVRKIASEEAHNSYLRIKNDLKPKKAISVKEAIALIEDIKKRVENLKDDK